MTLARTLAGGALLAALVLVRADCLPGQDGKDKKTGGPERKAAKVKLPSYWDRLDLTDAQREEVGKLNAEYFPKIEKLQEEVRRLQTELARRRVQVLTIEQKHRLVDIVTGDAPKANVGERQKGGAVEKEKPKKDPDK